jgi:hypothetical protein
MSISQSVWHPLHLCNRPIINHSFRLRSNSLSSFTIPQSRIALRQQRRKFFSRLHRQQNALFLIGQQQQLDHHQSHLCGKKRTAGFVASKLKNALSLMGQQQHLDHLQSHLCGKTYGRIRREQVCDQVLRVTADTAPDRILHHTISIKQFTLQ